LDAVSAVVGPIGTIAATTDAFDALVPEVSAR
jgi:hypothetical protein